MELEGARRFWTAVATLCECAALRWSSACTFFFPRCQGKDNYTAAKRSERKSKGLHAKHVLQLNTFCLIFPLWLPLSQDVCVEFWITEVISKQIELPWNWTLLMQSKNIQARVKWGMDGSAVHSVCTSLWIGSCVFDKPLINSTAGKRYCLKINTVLIRYRGTEILFP